MKLPKIALDLNLMTEKVKDKPVWQRHLYARMLERASDNTAKITYADRDAAAKNPRRDQIQKWYEQIYSELAREYGELHKEHEMLKIEIGHLHRSINAREDDIAELHITNLDLLAEKEALLDLITRAHTAEARVEDYVPILKEQRDLNVRTAQEKIGEQYLDAIKELGKT